ncbi:MAG: TrbI/VirB10 family protein [Gemmatimonadaceae bacterium]
MSQAAQEPPDSGAPGFTARRPTRPAGNMEDAVENLEARPIGARAPDVHALRRQNFSRRAMLWGGASLGLVLTILFVIRVFGGSGKKQKASSPISASKTVTTVDDGEIQGSATSGGKDSGLKAEIPVTGDTLVFKAPQPTGQAAANGDPRLVGGAAGAGAATTSGTGGNPGSSALPGGTADGLQLANGQPSGATTKYGGDTQVPRFNPTSPATATGGTRGAQAIQVADTAPHLLTRRERFQRIGGSIGGMADGGGDGSGSSPFSDRRSALAGDGGGDDASGSVASVQFVPGTRVKATIQTATPSATSGEPIQAVLDAPLVNRGRIIAPAGTRAIGKGTVFDDGTGNARLLINFTQFVLPDDRVLSLSGTSYSVEDNRPGLKVPINRQFARKGTRLGIGAGLAYGVAKVANRIAGTQQQSAFVEPSIGQQVSGEALKDAYSQARGELGLQSPPTGIVLSLPQDQQLLIVFGLGQN